MMSAIYFQMIHQKKKKHIYVFWETAIKSGKTLLVKLCEEYIRVLRLFCNFYF